MTWHAVWATALFTALATQHLWLRPRLRRHLAAAIGTPITRRLRNIRRTLAALDRAAHLRPHHGAHTISEGHRHADQPEHVRAA